MDEKLKSVIDKVRKLLQLSQSDNANEAATAAAMANKLLDQYRLSMADIDSIDAEKVIDDPQYIYSSKRMIGWKVALAKCLAIHYGCYVWDEYFISMTGRKQSNLRLAGRQSDIDIVKYMYAWLVSECERLSKKEAYGNGRVYVNSYYRGFVAGIADQLQKSRAEIAQQTTSTAIVKIDSRAQEAESWLKSRRKLEKAKGSSYYIQHDPSAYNAGQQRGKNIHLDKKLSATNGKLLGS